VCITDGGKARACDEKVGEMEEMMTRIFMGKAGIRNELASLFIAIGEVEFLSAN
jgi:hypothetical protein